jgi:capsular exopolysaccharide synthesis family protein
LSQLTQSSQEGGDSIIPTISVDYQSLFYRYRKNWYWFLLALLVAGGATWAQLRYSIPVYSTSATFIVEDPAASGGVSARQFTQQLGFSEEKSIEDELYVITSRSLMTEVVKELGLNLKITHLGKIRDTEFFRPKDFTVVPLDTIDLEPAEIRYGGVELLTTPLGRHYLVRGQDTTSYIPGNKFILGNRTFAFITRASYRPPLEESSSLYISHRDPENVAGGMLERLSVNRKGKSNTVQVSYVDVVPERAAEVVNQLIRIYNEKNIREGTLAGKQTVAFIDERLGLVSRELFAVEASLSSFRQREGVIVEQSVRGASYLEQLSAADAELSELEVRKSLIEEIRNQLQKTADTYTPVSVSSEIVDASLAVLINRYNELIFEHDQRLEVATSENPIVATYDEQLRELGASLQRSLRTMYQETNARADRLRLRIAPIEQSLGAIPDNERQILQIMRQQQIKQNLFVFLMEKREEAAITIAAQIPNTRIIDPARPSRRAVSPRPTQSYAMAVGLGLLLPAMFFFLREILDGRIQREAELKNRTSRNIIARIAKLSGKEEIAVGKDKRSAAAEMFRLLRTNLSFLFPLEGTPVVLVTSGVGGEGKTFISSNLSYTLAQGNKRTVLVGADMRKPRLFNATRDNDSKVTSSRVGLSNYLTGKAKYEEILQPTGNANLFIIESGPIPPNPAELLLRSQVTELIERLKQDFDVIIIDSPPVGLVSDALQLSSVVDVTLYVVKLGHTPKISLEVIDQVAAPGKLPNVQVVVNGVEFDRGYGYGYYQ